MMARLGQTFGIIRDGRAAATTSNLNLIPFSLENDMLLRISLSDISNT